MIEVHGKGGLNSTHIPPNFERVPESPNLKVCVITPCTCAMGKVIGRIVVNVVVVNESLEI